MIRALIVLCLSFFALAYAVSPEVPHVEVAAEKYLAAEKAASPEERERLLNEALAIYLVYAKSHPSGMLLNNIGNVYFYLGDYGMAICYYQRAELLMPRDPRIQKNLHIAISQADVVNFQQERPIADALGFRWCSPLERALCAIGAIAVTLIFFSLNLWLPSFGFVWLWRMSAVLTLAFLSALVWYALVVPVQAVVLKAAPLRASSETVFTEPTLTTVRPGEVVDVVGTDESHHWVRVRTQAQTTGFLPGQDVCFIE